MQNIITASTICIALMNIRCSFLATVGQPKPALVNNKYNLNSDDLQTISLKMVKHNYNLHEMQSEDKRKKFKFPRSSNIPIDKDEPHKKITCKRNLNVVEQNDQILESGIDEKKDVREDIDSKKNKFAMKEYIPDKKLNSTFFASCLFETLTKSNVSKGQSTKKVKDIVIKKNFKETVEESKKRHNYEEYIELENISFDNHAQRIIPKYFFEYNKCLDDLQYETCKNFSNVVFFHFNLSINFDQYIYKTSYEAVATIDNAMSFKLSMSKWIDKIKNFKNRSELIEYIKTLRLQNKGVEPQIIEKLFEVYHQYNLYNEIFTCNSYEILDVKILEQRFNQSQTMCRHKIQKIAYLKNNGLNWFTYGRSLCNQIFRTNIQIINFIKSKEKLIYILELKRPFNEIFDTSKNLDTKSFLINSFFKRIEFDKIFQKYEILNDLKKKILFTLPGLFDPNFDIKNIDFGFIYKKVNTIHKSIKFSKDEMLLELVNNLFLETFLSRNTKIFLFLPQFELLHFYFKVCVKSFKFKQASEIITYISFIIIFEYLIRADWFVFLAELKNDMVVFKSKEHHCINFKNRTRINLRICFFYKIKIFINLISVIFMRPFLSSKKILLYCNMNLFENIFINKAIDSNFFVMNVNEIMSKQLKFFLITKLFFPYLFCIKHLKKEIKNISNGKKFVKGVCELCVDDAKSIWFTNLMKQQAFYDNECILFYLYNSHLENHLKIKSHASLFINTCYIYIKIRYLTYKNDRDSKYLEILNSILKINTILANKKKQEHIIFAFTSQKNINFMVKVCMSALMFNDKFIGI